MPSDKTNLEKAAERLLRHKSLRRQYNLVRNFANWWVYYVAKLGIYLDDPLLFITRRGISIRVPKQLYPLFKSIFMREHYMEGLAFPLPECPITL